MILLFCLSAAFGYRAEFLPPETQTADGITFTLSAQAEAEILTVTAQVRNDSDAEFNLRAEQIALDKKRPLNFRRQTILPDAAETIVWRFRNVAGKHNLQILDLNFPLLVKSAHADLPYYLDKSRVYNFDGTRLHLQKDGAGFLLVDSQEKILDALLKSSQDNRAQFVKFDYAHWLITGNIAESADTWLLIKTRTSPEVYQVFDLRGRPVL